VSDAAHCVEIFNIMLYVRYVNTKAVAAVVKLIAVRKLRIGVQNVMMFVVRIVCMCVNRFHAQKHPTLIYCFIAMTVCALCNKNISFTILSYVQHINL
jgi:hypothetical protein